MPSYRACGITASLSTCDLKPTLSGFTDLRMGNEQRKDAARMQKALSAGEKLGERPIGADGSEAGILQFIGAHDHMPLLVVEASDQLRKQKTMARAMQAQESNVPGSSPLTSLGATPTPTHDAFVDTTRVTSSSQTEPQATLKTKTKPQTRSKHPASSQQTASSHRLHLDDALHRADVLFVDSEKALVLDIEMEHDSFLPTKGGSGSLGKDLKIEVYVNGELADVSFINARRSAVQIIGDKIRFTGTRVHRQTEKPWSYNGSGATLDQGRCAEKRWNAVSESLVTQARQRGTDKYGDLQPSAEFLGALAAIPLPERVKKQASAGIVDVIIVAGKGQKYGPETAYLTGPTPMTDPRFSTNNPAADPLLLPPQGPLPLFDGGAVVSPLKAMKLNAMRPPESSPEVPLRSRMLSAPVSPSPTKKTINLAREFGFDLTRYEAKMFTVGAFENRRGKARTEGRSLNQRLGDLKKMNEANRERALAKLREEVSSLSETGEVVDKQPEEVQKRPLTRARTDSAVNYVHPSMIFAEPNAAQEDNIDPELLVMSQPTANQIHKPMAQDDVFGTSITTNPDAVLTQSRIDLALDSGAASNGPLLRRIASTSPVKSPRKTTAAALAYSPTRTAIKVQKRRTTSTTPSPQKQKPPPVFKLNAEQNTLGMPTTPPRRPTAAVSPTKSSGRGANRTSTSWRPGEMSFTQALEEFSKERKAGLFEGSSVGYARDEGAMRQIGKARGGVFREEGVLVGVRFCVW